MSGILKTFSLVLMSFLFVGCVTVPMSDDQVLERQLNVQGGKIDTARAVVGVRITEKNEAGAYVLLALLDNNVDRLVNDKGGVDWSPLVNVDNAGMQSYLSELQLYYHLRGDRATAARISKEALVFYNARVNLL